MGRKKKSAGAATAGGAPPEGSVKARVLTSCVIDETDCTADDVVVVSTESLTFHKALGHLDDSPAAVEYAESLVSSAEET